MPRPHAVPESIGVLESYLPLAESLDREQLHQYLAQMPAEWVDQVYQAAIKGFDQVIIQLIDQIPTAYSPFAQQLKKWVDNFQFDPVIAIIQEISECRISTKEHQKATS